MPDRAFDCWLDHEWPNGAATGTEYDIDDLEAAFAAGRAAERDDADFAIIPPATEAATTGRVILRRDRTHE